MYVKIDIGKNRPTQQKLFIICYTTGTRTRTRIGEMKCTFHFTNSSSLPDDDPHSWVETSCIV
jgi:hypothetical protein